MVGAATGLERNVRQCGSRVALLFPLLTRKCSAPTAPPGYSVQCDHKQWKVQKYPDLYLTGGGEFKTEIIGTDPWVCPPGHPRRDTFQ